MIPALSRKDAISAKFRSLFGCEPTGWVRAPVGQSCSERTPTTTSDMS